jgi:hypothetical protein
MIILFYATFKNQFALNGNDPLKKFFKKLSKKQFKLIKVINVDVLYEVLILLALRILKEGLHIRSLA